VGTPGYPVLGLDESGVEYEFTSAGEFVRDDSSFGRWDLVKLVEDVAPPPLEECIASGASCGMGPHGPKGVIQCKYCGRAASRLYVAGPMTGYAAAAHYRSLGFTVVNPAEINGEDPSTEWIPGSPELAAHWAKCMRADLTALLTCDKIVMLDGWAASRGATLAHHVAVTLGMEVLNHA
jgi:hypothetical protein